MRKIISVLKIISFSSIILSFPVACTTPSHLSTKVSIYNNQMAEVTTKVNLNQDMYQDVLINDNPKTGDICFKNLLIQNMNNFGEKNNLILIYAVDYKFSIEGIDNPYNTVINQEGTINVDVKATDVSKKIIGSFKVKVNLVSESKSIADVGAKIGNQKYNDVIIGTTTFETVRSSYLNIIEDQIKKINNQAKAFVDYTINFEGYKLKDVITKNDLGIKTVNINAVGSQSNPLLVGNTSFQVELNIKK